MLGLQCLWTVDQPPGIDTAVEVIALGQFTAAIRQDLTVVAWGTIPEGCATFLAGLTDVVGLHLVDTILVALKKDHSVTAWDIQNDVAAANPLIEAAPETIEFTPVKPVGKHWVLTDAGEAHYWDSGVASHGNHPVAVAANPYWYTNSSGDIDLITLGDDGLLSLERDPNKYVTEPWWRNKARTPQRLKYFNEGYGVTAADELVYLPFYPNSPFHPHGMANVVEVVKVYPYISILRADGSVYTWGSSSSSTGEASLPAQVPNRTAFEEQGSWRYSIGQLDAVQISAARYIAYRDSQGRIGAWGDDVPAGFPGLHGNYIDLYAAYNSLWAVTAAGEVLCWGEGSNLPTLPEDLPPARYVAFDEKVLTVVLATGQVRFFGDLLDYSGNRRPPADDTLTVAV